MSNYLLSSFFTLQFCESGNPFNAQKLIECPLIYSEKYLVKHGGLPVPEDVIIYGKKINGYSQFYQIDEDTRETIMYGFEIRGEQRIAAFFRELDSTGVDTTEIKYEVGRKGAYFENHDGCIFSCSFVNSEKIQAVTSNQ